MAHVGILRDYRFGKDVDDIRGASIYGPDDDKLGKVDDIIFNHATGAVEYVVVDTGGWLSSRQFLVPADRIENRANDPRDLRCDLTKKQIERMPAYDEKTTETDASWGNYESHYRESVSTAGGVLHREGSDHLITPEAHEQPAASGSGDVDFTPTRLEDKFNMPSGTPSSRMRPAGTAARAEDTSRPGAALGNEGAVWQESDPSRSSNVTPMPSSASARDIAGSSEFNRSAYGDPSAQGTPSFRSSDPEAYRHTGDNEMAPGSGPYPTLRCQRLRDIEDHLKRNRVDVTASCGACGVQRDKAA
ncbi:MAG TPA: PRC-barrel domain-containing protein [candidate division Zixibacteria bacterium]|nr:PRC-barrel domain-containing protein [candidate division Zixibacteria bacterium]